MYSILEIPRDAIKGLNVFPKNHDPLFRFENILELAALDAFWFGLGENSESKSHHYGGRLLTVLYKPQKISLCETIRPFSDSFIGCSDDVTHLEHGLESFFGDMKHSKTDGLYEAKIKGFVERFYPNSQYGRYHRQLALNHVGIKI
jgi:hypothetical protein